MKIYLKFNNFRKSEFRLFTSIVDKEGKKIVVKKAETEEAKDFIKSLLKKRELLEKNKFSIEAVDVVVERNIAKFDFIEGISLDSLLIEAVNRRNKKEFFELMKDFISLVKKNNIIKNDLTDEFFQVFGNINGKNVECLEFGIVDLIFDNIISKKGEKNYVLIDYEWVFDFPIPYKFPIHRSIVSFYSKYRAYNLNKFVHINEIYKLANISDEEKSDFIEMESNFQNYVLRIGKDFEGYRKGVMGLEEKEISTNKISFDILLDLDILREKNEHLKKEINFMRKSKFWILRNKYLNIKNFFKKYKTQNTDE